MTMLDVDPTELRFFQNRLADLRLEIQAHRIDLEKRTQDLHAHWSDEKYQRLVKEQEDLMLQIQYFEQRCYLYCEYLTKKADAADYYLSL